MSRYAVQWVASHSVLSLRSPAKAELHATQRATVDSRVVAVSLGVCNPSRCYIGSPTDTRWARAGFPQLLSVKETEMQTTQTSPLANRMRPQFRSAIETTDDRATTVSFSMRTCSNSAEVRLEWTVVHRLHSAIRSQQLVAEREQSLCWRQLERRTRAWKRK